MASITIRQLDDELKKRLRLRAASHGRSMEDEARVILRAAAGVRAEPDTMSQPRALKRVSKPQATLAAGVAQASGVGRVLLIIGGGIAAYKSLDLIRRLMERGLTVRAILTRAAQEFITPLSAGALTGERVFTDLFDTASEFDVGHIRLARETDLVIVAPATADLVAKMAGGHADDLATAVLLATDAPILIAPAMNPMMWANRATRRNIAASGRSRASAWSSPQGRRTSRSIRCATSPTAPPAGRATPLRRQQWQRAPRWCWCPARSTFRIRPACRL